MPGQYEAVGVFMEGELVGVLSENTAKKVRTRLKNGEQITGKISKLVFNNFNNGVQDDLNPGVVRQNGKLPRAMRPASALSKMNGFVQYAVVRGNEIGLSEETEEGLAAKAYVERNFADLGFTRGQVVALFQKPTGEYTAIPVSTAQVGEKGANELAELIVNNAELSTIADQFGISGQSAEDTNFIVEQMPDGDLLISFRIGDKIVSYNLAEFQNLMNGEPALFSVGKYVKDDSNKEESVVKFEREGDINAQERAEIAGIARTEAMKRMAAVRKQVDVEAMADPAYRKAAEENDLQTDLFPGAGNVPFHDPLVKITLDGETKEAVDNSTPPVKEPVPTSTREETADMPAPDTEYGEDDLFGAPQEQKSALDRVEDIPNDPRFGLFDGQGNKVQWPASALFFNKIKQLRQAVNVLGFLSSGEQVEQITKMLNDIRAAANQGIDVNTAEGQALVQEIEDLIQEVAAGIEVSPEAVTEYKNELDRKIKSRQPAESVESRLINHADGTKSLDGRTMEYFFDRDQTEEQSAAAAWEKPLEFIKGKINTQAFRTWFAPIKPVKLEGNVLTVQVPSQFFVDWLNDHYTDLLKEALGPDVRLQFVGSNVQDQGKALRLGEQPNLFTKPGDTEAAKKFLQERFGKDSVSIFTTMQMIGDNVVHGYVQNGAVHLWNNAEIGTEYHEGFHMFFRTMLTDEQREQLYNDAAEKYGEPTAEEIAAARRGQSELTDAEARLLALEEKMAEEFRGYMLNEQEVERTLPQRIAKFFKDMLAYIKAVITDRVSVNQAFSLIEKNRIPKRFSRNAKAFSPGDAFMLQQYASNPQMHTELIDTAVYIGLNAIGQGATESDLLGSQLTQDESELRNWFLRHSMHKAGGRPMSDTEFADLKNGYDQGIEQAREVIQRLGLRPGAPIVDALGNPMPAQVAENASAAAHFRSVYDRWFDVEAELGGTKLRGFRSDVAERLKTYGFDPKSKEEERIFGLSRMKENPAKKLNDKTKRMLSRIPVSSTENTYFGFQTYVPIMDIYTEIAGSVYNSADIDSMLERLEIRSRHIPHLRDVYNFVNNLSDQEKALFYSSMSLTMNEFRMMILDNDENGNRTVRILNPGASSIESFYSDKWKKRSRGPGGIYSVTVEDGVPSVTVNQDKKTRAANFLKVALSETGAGVGDAQYNALANGLWELGIELGGTKELARENVKKTFDGFGSAKWTRFMGESGANIRELLNDVEKGRDVHTESSGRIREIADVITKNFVAPPAMSFVNGAGSLIFPLNQKTDLDITKELIESGEYAEMMDGAVGHTAGETKSFATVIVSNEKFQKEFVPVDFDSLKTVEGERSDLYENDDMSFEQALAVEMNMFRNPSNPDLLYIPLDTQGDRNRLTFIPIPNFLNDTRSFDARYKLGLDGLSKQERIRKILTNQILVDLNRIAVALEVSPSDTQIKGYHTQEQFRNLQTGGRLEADQNKIARLAAVYAEGHQETMPEELAQFVDAQINNLLEKRDGYVSEVIAELGSEEELRQFLNRNVPGVKKGQEIAFLEDYITSNMIGRMVSREIFRSGINYVSDGADYNKRSAHTTTPGTVLMIQREEGGYGMKPNFTEITVKDIVKSLPKEDLDAFQKQLVANGLTEEQASKMLDNYRVTENTKGIQTTDAQAFITMDMYRSIRQGMGMWTEKEDALYDDFQKSGKWKGKLKPLKPSYEFRVEHNGHLLPIMHKNSYIVLTPDLVQGIAPLEQLYNRMTAQDKFEGLEKIDVVNTVSAKKLATFDPVDGTSEAALRGVPVQTLDSRGFKLPQILPETFKDQITFGRQPRKNMIANIDDNTMYMFNGQEISGADLKALYQSALVAKLRLNQEKVFQELGYDAVINAETEVAKLKAIESMLPKLRKKMEELGVEKDYTQNFLDALQLTKDDNGNLTTRLPLSFPSVHSKLDQLLLGLFRTQVYQQKLAGQEMVQFSEFGAGEAVSNLGQEIEDIYDSDLPIPRISSEEIMNLTAPSSSVQYDVSQALAAGFYFEAEGLNKVQKTDMLKREMALTRTLRNLYDGVEGLAFAQGKSVDQVLEEYFGGIEVSLGEGRGTAPLADLYARQFTPSKVEELYRLDSNLSEMIADSDLKFYRVEGETILEAEVDIHPAVLKRMGVDIKQPIEEINKQVQRLLGYRIPQQGKSSMLVMKIRRLLPESAVSSIRVPAGVTTMMGSDFDIDKMFVVFPELEKGQRVEFDINQDPATMTEKQLNNMIFETFAAVGTNVTHLDEILGGVEIADLDAARTALGKSKQEIDINSPVQRIQTGIDNMLSLALRGAYANAIAGRNVAQASGVAWVSSPGREMIVNGQVLDRIVDRSPFSNKYTDQYLSQYLSGAIDSVKDPLQEQINDNRLTANLTVYMMSLGMTPTQAVAFLNVPAVRAVTDQARKKGVSLGRMLNQFNAEPTQIILNEEEMLKIARGEKTDYNESDYVGMLAMMHEESQSLGNLYRALTPDAIDQAGTTAQHLAMLDNLENLEGKTFGGPAALREVIEGDAYPITREYYEAIKQSLEVGRRVGFIGTQPGVMQFKSKLKNLLGKTEFNEQQHRDINRAVLHYIVTQPGSPIFESGLLDTNRIQNLHLDGAIATALADAKASLKEGETNAVLDSLEVVTEPLENGETLTYLQVDPSKVRTKLEKEIWTATMEGMVNDKARFGVINNAIFSNMIITSGFAPGPFAAFDLLPISMFEKLGVTTHLNAEMKKLEQGDNYLDRIGFTEEFMSSYGTHRIGKNNLIEQKESTTAFVFKGYLKDGVTKGTKRKGKYLVVHQGKEKHLFVLQGNRYMPALTKGRQYMFYEANLRDSATGEKYHGSVLSGKRTPSPDVDTYLSRAGITSMVGLNVQRPDTVGLSRDEIEVMQLLEAQYSPERRAQAQESLREAESGERGISKAEDAAVRQAMEAMMPPTEAFETLEEYEAEAARVKASKEYQDLQKQLSIGQDVDVSGPGFEDVDLSKDLKLGKKEKPAGAQAKIKKLTEAFAAAGIEVRVVQGELPAGVKGQVQGNVITIDPNQITEDTVYHEFGHILVDMLPEDEVRKYVQQVVKADPLLARTVKAEYPELEGLALGKEILVTAIGLEGAKLERKNPSKLQRLVNKILRAIGKLFGVQPNAAAVLAEQMFGAEIKAEQLSGKFNKKLQNSRDLRDELTAVSEDTLKSLKRQQIRLENLPESEQTRERLREIKTLERNIRKIQKREDELNAFMDFADYAFARINRLDMLMGKVQEKAKDPSLSKAEKLELLREIGEMKQTLDSLYNTRAEKSTITKMSDLLAKTKFEGETEETTEQVKRLLNDLDDTLRDARRLEQEFSDAVLPIVADVLLTYANPEINDQLKADIQRLRDTKDISGYGRFAILQNNPEHKQLRARLRNGEITKEEFREQALELKIEDLKKKIVGREQLVQEMRDAHNSKSWFSHMMDPMVYSNEANLQLFSLAIKDAVNNATEKSRGFLYELEEQYNDFKPFMGSAFNEAKFNDDLLTTVTINGVEMLSLVSQYDTQKFYAARDAELARLNAKYKVPEDKAEYDGWKFDPQSGKISQAYRDHRRELIIWYRNNTTEAPGARQTLAALEDRIDVLQQKIDVEQERDVKNIMITEIKELQEKRYRSYSKTGVFMEEMAIPNDNYLSEKYQKIQSTPELKKYYDFIVGKYALAQQQIGSSQLFINSWDTMSYIMPSVRKDRLAALQQEGWRDLAKEELKDFTRLNTDTQFGMMTDADGERVRSIPRFYTNRVDAKDVSRDIAASMAQFVHMANLFEEKSKTVGLVESMMSIHEQRLTIPRDSKTGLPIIDKVSEMARGVQDDVVKEDPRNNRNYQHLREFVDSVFYGQLDLEQGAILGVDMSKLAGKAAAFTAITNLAFNTLQVGNQFVLDNLMGSEEAVAGQFFGKRDFAWAAKTYAANKGALSDLGAFVPKSKLGQAMMMFDALNEVTDSIGKGVTGSKLKKAIQNDPLFALQHAVEHQSTATRMLALLRSYKGKLLDSNGKVLLNEKGQEADLWDMLVKDEKGKFIIDPRVANVQKNEVIAKLHGINKRANQIKGSHDRSMGNRRALGKLALLFRNYFVPGLRKRFGHGESMHVDYELGSVTRGMYQSLMGYFSLIPYEGVTAYQMMSETDKQNLRRATYEAAATIASLTTFLVLNAMLDDDENEDNYVLAYTAYQARRLQSELLQFVNPSEFLRMAQSPMATVNWLDKYATVIGQGLFKEPGYALGLVDEEDIFYQRRTGTAEKGDRKVVAQLKKIIPVLNGYQTSFLKEGSAAAVEEKLRWFN